MTHETKAKQTWNQTKGRRTTLSSAFIYPNTNNREQLKTIGCLRIEPLAPKELIVKKSMPMPIEWQNTESFNMENSAFGSKYLVNKTIFYRRMDIDFM